jgi:hypothetical protein
MFLIIPFVAKTLRLYDFQLCSSLLIDTIITCPDLSPLLQHMYLDQAGLVLMLPEDNQNNRLCNLLFILILPSSVMFAVIPLSFCWNKNLSISILDLL